MSEYIPVFFCYPNISTSGLRYIFIITYILFFSVDENGVNFNAKNEVNDN